MNVRNLLAGIAVAMSLAACQTTPPQSPIALTKENLAAQKGRVAVGIRVASPDLYLPGANCLLCIGAATVANSSLNTYTKTLKTDELVAIRAEIVEDLRKKGVDAAPIDAPIDFDKLSDLKLGPNFSTKDFAPIAKGFDHVVVINIQQIGFVRNYAAYVPTSDAKATLAGFSYMVDLKTNRLEWFDHLVITRSADGAWDEAPSFPGLTNAYFQAIEQAKDRMKGPFVQ
ncbi:MAG TPA: hypothetical protein VIP05_05900 [Burkholderiaceae bacterium]